jgi:hypothetical protein
VRAAGNALTHALDTPKLLGVDMNEIAWPFVLIANNGLGGLQVAQSRQPGALQNPADGALGHAQARRDPGLRQAPASQLDDRQGLLGLGLPRTAFGFG